MKLKTLSCAIGGITLASFVSGSAMAGASAKFAATWTDSPALASVADTSGYRGTDTLITDSRTGYTMATIKVPQGKEALIGVSAEIGLVTDTSIRGKNGGSAKSLADAEAYVTVYAVPTGTYDPGVTPAIMAAPGAVMLSKRVQELSATLGGVIQSCTDGDTNFDGAADTDPDGTIDVATECIVTDEQIGLFQDTTAAHHFNFVITDMTADEYDIVAVFSTGSKAQIEICDSATDYCNSLYDADGTVSGAAYAKAIINKTMVTVQEVRAVKGGAAAGTLEVID